MLWFLVFYNLQHGNPNATQLLLTTRIIPVVVLLVSSSSMPTNPPHVCQTCVNQVHVVVSVQLFFLNPSPQNHLVDGMHWVHP